MERVAYRVGEAGRPAVGPGLTKPGRVPEWDAASISDAFRRASRRRRVARWAAFAGALLCALALASFGVSAYGDSFSGRGHVEPVLAIESGNLPGPPKPPTLDMGRVWSAATIGDPWPGLATDGNTGTSGGRVSLTFDDGPDPVITPQVLDTLREHDLKATFFVVGRRVAENPDLLRRVVEEGHSLGNHTYNHVDMADLDPTGMRRELRRTQRAVDDALGYHHPMVLMRPPYGSPYFGDPAALPVVREVVRDQGLFAVAWTLDPRDYMFDGRPDNVARRVARADGQGERDEVILLHDTNRQSAEALPEIIAHYNSSRIRFATVDELLADKYAGS